jgi:hypothetical protein
MSVSTKPHITIKNNAQKGGYKFSDILTDEILSDVCLQVTKCSEYSISYDNEDYNKGRLALIEYKGKVIYVSFSEHGKVEGRNSFFQSLTTAFISYCSDARKDKRIVFYFLPSISGHFEGDYFRFMYRLMATNGVEFLNAGAFLENPADKFSAIDDIISARSLNRRRNEGNNSTYITRSAKGVTQIYGKTYGASKKETTLLCLAAARLSRNVELYEICEKDLKELPAPDKEAIQKMGNVEIIPTNRIMDKNKFETDSNYRSPAFIYNLFQKFQKKECAFCECNIPEIIAAAHIWAVSEIKRAGKLSDDEKYSCATDGENGLWLCHNHHKMFDENLVTITKTGNIIYGGGLNEIYKPFIDKTTTKQTIPSFVLTDKFSEYLDLRAKTF